jgi:hypothetical protein
VCGAEDKDEAGECREKTAHAHMHSQPKELGVLPEQMLGFRILAWVEVVKPWE